MELFEEATELHKAGKYKEAEEKYDLLFTQNPNNAGLIATYATLCLQTDKIGLAISLYHRALEKLPNQSEVLSNLGLAYKKAGMRDKAFQYLDKACKFNPTAEALSNYGGLYTQTNNPDKTIDLCSPAISKNPEIVITHWNLTLPLLESGKWGTSWEVPGKGLQTGPKPSQL